MAASKIGNRRSGSQVNRAAFKEFCLTCEAQTEWSRQEMADRWNEDHPESISPQNVEYVIKTEIRKSLNRTDAAGDEIIQSIIGRLQAQALSDWRVFFEFKEGRMQLREDMTGLTPDEAAGVTVIVKRRSGHEDIVEYQFSQAAQIRAGEAVGRMIRGTKHTVHLESGEGRGVRVLELGGHLDKLDSVVSGELTLLEAALDVIEEQAREAIGLLPEECES